MSYLHDNVFLDTETAQQLYHEVAATLPVIDFHTHLLQDEILANHQFANLWELWLKHDHYKWRLMRACGVPEEQITGAVTPWEKFEAFASILPLAVGNPVHHWAHLELKRVFGIDETLSSDTAPRIWEQANQQLNEGKHRVNDLLERFNVELICTTDDPASCLDTHHKLADNPTAVLPTFRPDNAMAVDQPEKFKTWITSLEERVGKNVGNLAELLQALKERHDAFHLAGCRLSDHGLPYCPTPSSLSGDQLNSIFQNALYGAAADSTEHEAFSYYIMQHVAQWNTNLGWTMQLHLGPQRNTNSVMCHLTGPDSGFDTMGSWQQTPKLIDFLNALRSADLLGKTIVYNLNPTESEAICCALQNFQSSDAVGLLQYGPAWWHLDHVRGIREQLDILMSLGAIGTSVGMLTDSRSFTSYVRHEYFRRLLCQLLGKAAEAGEIPAEPEALRKLIADICYHNPASYFNWPNRS